MTVLAGRRESFNAAHQLRDPALSDEQNRRLFGKCANLHGHNYVLEMVVADDIDQATGYLLDLKLLSDIIPRQVIRDVDHRNLNTDVPWLKSRVPSTENLARGIPGTDPAGAGAAEAVHGCGLGDCLKISITDLTRDAGRCPAGRTSDGAARRPGLPRPGPVVLRSGDDCGSRSG